MKKPILILLFLILLSSLVYSDKIYESGDTGLILISPHIEQVQEDQSFYASLMVFNTTNGMPYLTESGITCVISLQLPNGSYVLEDNMTFNGGRWEYTITPLGLKNYVYYKAYCYNGDKGGVVTDVVHITPDGKEPYNPIALVIGFSFVSLLYLYFAFKLDENHFILKLLLIFFALYNLILIPSIFLSNTYAATFSFFKLSTNFFKIFGLYFLVYIIYYQFKDTESWLRKKFK